MDESGPCETDCPAAILDLLTETDSEWAKQWRERCRKRLQRKAPVAGETIVLATSLKFTDGAVLSRFRIVAHQGCGRKKLLFQSEDGGFLSAAKPQGSGIHDRTSTASSSSGFPHFVESVLNENDESGVRWLRFL
jgi:hypothetical protein